MYVDEYSISGEQVRAARALLRVDQKQIALAAGVSLETIKRLEAVAGPINVTSRTLSALRNAFLKLGVVFDGREDADLAVGWVRRDVGALLRPAIPRSRHPRSEPKPLTRLLFWSRLPADGGTDADAARAADQDSAVRRRGAEVSGAELEYGGFRLRALEGPTEVVLALFETLQDEGADDQTTLIQSRAVTGRLFDSWSVLGGDPDLVEDILVKDAAVSGDFHPGDLSPAAVMGLFVLLLISQAPRWR